MNFWTPFSPRPRGFPLGIPAIMPYIFAYQPLEDSMETLITISVLSLSLFFFAPALPEAPTGFDNKTNGLVDDATHQADQAKFEETEAISGGLGPLSNTKACRECHQNPTSGG